VRTWKLITWLNRGVENVGLSCVSLGRVSGVRGVARFSVEGHMFHMEENANMIEEWCPMFSRHWGCFYYYYKRGALLRTDNVRT
jgi:hypothetical protein